MTFVTLEQAKSHLRVDGADEDADITLKLEAAEGHAVEYLNRHVYADQAALDAAKAAAPAALTAATAAYEAAMDAAEAMENVVERDIATLAACEDYVKAQSLAKRTHRGMVINDQIKAAVLLTLGHLYENREDVVAGVAVTELPTGAKCLLRPHRAIPGV